MNSSTEQIQGAPLTIKRHNEGYWQVTIDAPPFNLFGPELLTGLEDVVSRMKSDRNLRVIVFDSAIPDYFIAHFDTVKGGELLTRKTPSGMLPWFDVAIEMHKSPVISISSIRGRARGVGIEFAAACDIRFASEKAVFGQFEVGVSTIPGGGSMELLPLLIGRSRALELIVGADDIDAATAERYGLINRQVSDDKLDDFVHRFATRISHFDPAITGMAKTMINERSPLPSLEQMNESRSAFIKANMRPERKKISEALRDWGIQQNHHFEYNLGSYLDQISNGTTYQEQL